MSFPQTLTGAIDGVTEIVAAHLNNLEEKVGINNSLDPASLDYILRSTSSTDPGHKHTAGAFTGGFAGDVFFRDPADSLWKPVGPDSAGLVAKTGAQTIAGVKTFSSIPILPASNPTTDNEATRKAYVDAQDALKVAKAGDAMSGNLAMGGNDITGVGTLAAATAQLTNPLAVIYGGTGLGSVAAGDILYASAANTLAALTKTPTGSVLLSGDAPAWGKVGLTTHVDGVLPVANGGTGAANAWTTAQDPGHKHSKLWASDGDPEAVTVDAAGNVMVGASAVGDSAAKVVGVANGTDPTTSPADMFQMWSKDQAAGNACPHFRTENGAVIKLYKEAALTAGLTQITHTEPGTPDYAISDLTQTTPYGFASQDEGNTVLKVIKNLQVRVDELEDKFQAIGLLN